MVLKIERDSNGQRTVLRLSGRMQLEHVRQLEAQMAGRAERVVLDLEEVKLVDLEVVRFLGACEANGTELRNCSPYIRNWILKERAANGPTREQS